MNKPRKLLFFLFFLLSALIPLQNARDAFVFEFGTKPQTFCLSHDYKDLPLTTFNTFTSPSVDKQTSGDQLVSVRLTKEALKNAVGAIWYNSYQDWSNGFVTEFNMKIENPTCMMRTVTQCKIGLLGYCFWEKYASVESRCGADGYAFVLQSSGPSATGVPAGGLGYKMLSNAFAIEFDTWTNEELNDPVVANERHISVIATKGQATANEVDSIAWNDNPANFKSDKYDGFIYNPLIRIEYLNHNLRVFMNNVLQLAYYDVLDISKLLGIANNKFFMGFTASSSAYSQDVELTNWKVKIVLPSAKNSYAALSSTNAAKIRSNDFFTVDLFVRDACLNRYVPTDAETIKDVTWIDDSTDDCELKTVALGPQSGFADKGATYVVTFSCSRVGDKVLQLKYKGAPISNSVNVHIDANVMTRAKTNIMDKILNNQNGNVDTGYNFTLKPLDSGDNLAQTTPGDILSKISVVWENPADTRTDHSVTPIGDGSYNFHINTDKAYSYNISSSLFLNEIAGGWYKITADVGSPNPNNSYAILYDANDPNNVKDFKTATVDAGQNVQATIVLKDKLNNTVFISESLAKASKFTLYENGNGKVLSNYNTGIREIDLKFQMVTKGTNMFVAYYDDEQITCLNCIYNIKPLDSEFSNADLYVYDSKTKAYGPNNAAVYTINKGDKLNYLLVLRDQYDNVIENIKLENYKATLSGNSMKPLTLSLTQYTTSGLLVQVQETDLSYFQNLVGKPNYVITVQEIDSNESRTFSLTIVSDGSDSDASNEDYSAIRTSITWAIGPTNNKCTVGKIYRVAVKLLTAKGARYNGWIDENLIEPTMSPFNNNTETIYSARKDLKPGMYLIDFMITEATGKLRVLSFKINGSIVLTRLRFYDLAGDAYQGFVDNLAVGQERTMNSGTVLKPYLFTFTSFDKFMNEVDVESVDLVLRLKSQPDLINLKPDCTKTSLGTYGCSFIPNIAGDYSLNSGYFINGSYALSIGRGKPDASFTEGKILNDLTQPILAGTEVSFQLTVKDQQGSQLTQQEVLNYVGNFSLNLLYADGNTLTPLTLTADNVLSTGEILTKTTLTKTGKYKFLPTYVSLDVKCTYCALSLDANIIDVNKVQVSLMQGDQTVVLVQNNTILLDNNKYIPKFLMEFYDTYGNKRTVENNFTNFSGSLVVPESDHSYTFNGNGYMGNILFSFSSDEMKQNYQKELKTNETCTLSFSAVNVLDQRRINNQYKANLQGNEFDDQFTYEDPDPNNVLIIPNKVSSIAGQFITVSVELRAKNGKLFFDQKNNGFYPDNLSPFTLIPEAETSGFTLQVSKGKLNGTYILTFNVTKAYYSETKVFLSYANHDDNSQFIKATNPLVLVVSPAAAEYVTVNDPTDLQRDCQADTRKIVNLLVFDRFSNRIYNGDTGSLGLKFSQDNNDIVPVNSLTSDGVTTSILCKKAGLVNFLSIGFRDSKGVSVEKYSFNIVAGSPDPLKSTASLSLSSINAGDTVQWRIYPADVYGNKISNSDRSFLDKFSSSVIYPNSASSQNITGLTVSDDQTYLYYSLQYDQAGVYKFQAFVNNQNIFSSNYILTVKPLEADWTNVKLAVWDNLANAFNEYDGEEVISQSIYIYPEFRINLYDSKSNLVENLPTGWTLSLQLTGQNLSEPIIFCPKSGTVSGFVMCGDNGLQPNLDKSPKERWDELVQNKNYTLQMAKESDKYRFGGILYLTGNDTDDGTSNLPVDIKNTIITPSTPLITTAGVSISFKIELRTTNKNLRPNWFYDDPNQNITLTFKYDNQKVGDTISVNVIKGDLKGRYVATISSKKTYLSNDPNAITLSFDNVEFSGYKPLFIVNPGSIDKVVPYDSNKSAVLTQLPSANSDNVYSTEFKAFDSFGNDRPITVADAVQIKLVYKEDQDTSFASKINAGLLNVSFQPQNIGQYTYIIALGSNYSFEITQGEAFYANCMASVNVSANESVIAGSIVELSVRFYDKWGNRIVVSNEILSNLFLKYFFKRPDVTEGFIVGNNSGTIDTEDNSVKFLQQVVVKGIYTFRAAIRDNQLPMKQSTVKVVPAAVNLSMSNLRYYDTDASRYLKMSQSNAIKEDNLHTVPQYTLEMTDSYGNTYDIFPADLVGNIPVILFGHSYNESSNPIVYAANSVVGNALYINLSNSTEVERYHDAVYRSDPYSLRLTLSATGETVIYPIMLMGEGKNDTDAESEQPLNLSLTVLSKNVLNFRAGEYDSFVVELRDINNKRKVDVDATFTYQFKQADGLNDGNYKAFAIDGDLRGRYLITVNGTKSTLKTGATILTLLVNGEAVPKTLTVNVSPNDLSYIKIPTDLTRVGATDENYLFDVYPYDKYNNIVDVEEIDVNLRIKYPSDRSTYQVTKDLDSGKLAYSVLCKTAGDYIIESPLLASPQKFTVVSGKPSADTSSVYVSPTNLVVGETANIVIVLADSYNNRIYPSKTANILSQVSLTIQGAAGTIPADLSVNQNETLNTNFTTTTAGVATINVLINGKPVQCESCSVVFKPGSLDISKTKFFTQQSGDSFVETKTIQIGYGTERLSFMCYLYDKYNNAITGTNSSETFSMVLSGNYMNPLTLTVNKQVPNILLFDLNSDYGKELSRIVPASNYTLELTYLIDEIQNSKDDLGLQILGDDNGYGNGNWSMSMIDIDPVPTLHLIAGVEGFFRLEFYTKQNKRYNGIIDPSTVKIFDETDSAATSNETLQWTVYPGDANGKLSFGFKGFVAINRTQQKKITFTINGKHSVQDLFIYITPNIPDLSLTELSQSISETSISGVTQYISLKFYDTYKNPCPTSGMTSQVFAKVEKGQASFLDTIAENDYIFKIPVIPLYPPSLLQLMVFFKWSENMIYPILSSPLVTTVRTHLEPNKTEIIGQDLFGITTDQELNFYVLLKDKAGYCFEESRNVTVNVSGPYIPGTTTKISSFLKVTEFIDPNVTALNSSNLSNTSYPCQKVYYAHFAQSTLQAVGYYKIEAYIDGENNGNAVKTINYTYVRAGVTDPKKSILSVPQLIGRGRTPLDLEVNTCLMFSLRLADNYGNLITEYRNTTKLSVEVNGFSSSDYKIFISNHSDGSYSINLTVLKTGVVQGLQINLNNVALVYEDLAKKDVPDYIDITAGPCAASMVYVEKSIYATENVTTGEVNKFNIQCRDQFGNVITKGGNTFGTIMSGTNLDTVGVDYADAHIYDNNNGNYTYTFTVIWAGNYTVTIQMDGDPVGGPFYINAVRSKCTDDKLPYYCENINICTDDYLKCGYDFLTGCPDSKKPYRCKVDGVETCVAGSFDCDCPDNYYKCPADKKCVPFEWADALCSNVLMTNCPTEYPYFCENTGGCRINPNNCASQPGCPPNYILCADLTCAHQDGGCKNFSSNDFNCPLSEPWKCEDQSCVWDPSLCSTRITCSNPSDIICPDKTCQPSELKCRPAAKCEGMYLCPDQSCRPSRDDCPKAITCPLGYALCEDKTCKTDCGSSAAARMLKSIKKFGQRVLETSPAAISSNCRPDYYVCPGGECVSNQFLCPTVSSCGAGKRVCPDFSCAGKNEKCVVKSCTDGQTLCWDGKCVDSADQCSTRSTCPSEYPIKCLDGSCTKSVVDCPEDIKCPAYYPYRCATGECRANEKECPTLITCPSNKPIQCTDGSCVVSPINCLAKALLRKCDFGEILCPDGSCSKSKLLCPPIPSCNPNQIRCWDNTCADNITLCDPLEPARDICPNDKKLRCPDGSCRAALKDCPTQLICPVNRPVKCDDGTCKQSIKECALGTECGYGLKRCPDGSCTNNENLCGTAVTCSKEAPYICFDSTCKKDPRDCPSPPQCSSHSPILCPDGTCTSQRVNCKRLEKCDSLTPVRCPNMNCYTSADNCTAIEGCPTGKVLCEDGSCASSISYCPIKKCPDFLSLQCSNGQCVNDLKFCDNNVTACPYAKPFKCPDGTCTNNLTKCTKNVVCPNNLYLCPDGSCSINNASCYNEQGCPWETPVLCATGDCIDPTKGSCPIASCPKETPVKCMDGLCAKSITVCASFFTPQDILQCLDDPLGNLVPCADGRCVPSADLCKPLFKCPSGKVRCDDGSCRSMKAFCPLANSSCPATKPHRCSIGACALSEDDCPNQENGCPLKAPVKCKDTGSCVANETDCITVSDFIILLNDCPMSNPFKCSNGTCAKNESLCQEQVSCQAGSLRCPNGRCVTNKTACNEPCPNYTCPDGTCANDRDHCLAENGCPLSHPFKCADGSCRMSPLAINGEKGCYPHLVCPDYKPYLCSNGECQGSPSQCQVQKPCPADKKFRCPDYSCVSKQEECSYTGLCPIATPILCGSGKCVASSLECINSDSSVMYCPDEKPILCASGRCEKYAWNCTDSESRKGNLQNARRRLLLERSVADTSDASNVVVCSDGSFRLEASGCVVIPSCPPGKYRCNSSACVDRMQDCKESDALLEPCVQGTTRCLDGVCRETCLNYQGCPFDRNFHCGNGLCARNEGECAGDSVCENGYFRCIDNTCVTDAKVCSTPLRNYASENLKITVSPSSTSSVNFIQQGSGSIRLATLTLPAGALLPANSSEISKEIGNGSNSSLPLLGLLITPVANNLVENYTTKVETTRLNYVEKIFPYTAGTLDFHQTVRSPIINLQSVNRAQENYKFPLILDIQGDLVTNSSKTDDYCLATIDNYTKNWKCVTRNLLNKDDTTTNNFMFPVPEDGLYTVVFAPKEQAPDIEAEPCGWFCENKWTILYVFIGIIVAGLIGSYIIWRVSRYVNKYKAAKRQMANFREQISEMEKAKTDVLGQTLRDKIEGISFTTNPAFRKESSATAKEREKKLLESINEIHQRDRALEQSNKELTEKNQALLEKIEELKQELGKEKVYGESMDIKEIERQEFE